MDGDLRAWARGSILASALMALGAPASAQVATGTYDGNGSAGRSITVGFRPNFVFIKVDYENIADNDLSSGVIRTAMMTGDNAKPLTGIQALMSGLITSLDVNGFTVGNDLRVNAAGASCGGTCTYYWTVFGADPDFAMGSYTGNGTSVGDPQSITGLGFSPEYVMVLPATTRRAGHRTTAGGTFSRRMSPNGSALTDAITSMDADGFTVTVSSSAGDNPNENSQTYYYAAWNAAPGKMVIGEYLGNGVNNRQIIGTSFSPSWLILSAYDDGKDPIHRTKDMPTDAGSSFRKDVQTGYVRALLPNGFQIGSNNVVNEAGFNFFWVAFGNQAACPPMTVSESGGTITTTAAGSFELRFNSSVGGSIDQWYELNRDPDRSTNLMNNTGANNEYALNDFALYNAPTTYQLNAETAAALELLEVTPLRTLVRAEGELGNVAGFDYRQKTTAYSSGKLYNRMQFTNNTGGPLSTYQVNWYAGADYSVNWLGLTDPEGTLSDATEPNAYTDDYALKYANAASPGDEHFGNILFIPSRDYSEFSETGWEWKNDSGDDGGYIKLMGTETFGVGGGIIVTHNTVLKSDAIESIAEARPFADDYRLPDVLNVTTGSEWFHASESTSSPSDSFNEAEGAYTLDFDPTNGLVFDIDGGTTERRLPVYKIRQWRSLGGASSVSFTGTLPWCTTPIEADSSLGPDSHHPIISLSGIPSAVMVLRILHPILASTLCAANPLARIAEPTIAL